MPESDNEQPAGGRLRWWQPPQASANPSTSSRWYVDPPVQNVISSTGSQSEAASRSEFLDIGDELEVEAQRRAALESSHREHGWFIPLSNANLLKQIRWRMASLFLVLTLFTLGLDLATKHSMEMPWMLFAAAAYFAAITMFASRRIRRYPPPEIGLSHVGVSLNGVFQSGLLEWRDVESIERKRIFGTRMIVIKPKDPKSMDRFMVTKRGPELQTRKRFGEVRLQIPRAIYVSEATLPVSVEDFLTRIERCRAAAIPAVK